MKRSILASLTTAAAVLALTAAAPTATASSDGGGKGHIKVTGNIKIVDQGRDATGGWVAYTGEGSVYIDGTKTDPLAAYQEVGGGQWWYGSSVNGGGQKTCNSQYMHYAYTHGASVKMNGMYDWDTQGNGILASAVVTGWTNATCYAYWSVN